MHRPHGRNQYSTNELVKPESEQERTRSVIEDILRWADDGGQMLDLGILIARHNSDTAGK